MKILSLINDGSFAQKTATPAEPLKLTPAAQCGLVNDPDPVRDELPARPAYDVVDACCDCAAAVEVLRAEVQRLRREADRRTEHVRELTEGWATAREKVRELLRENESLRIERRALLPNSPAGLDEGLRAAVLDAAETGEVVE